MWAQQAIRSEIRIQTDPVVAGVRVQVTGARASVTVVTDAVGRAKALLAPPGPYKVRTETAGYQTFERELAVEFEAAVDLMVPMVAVGRESVTVEATLPVAPTETVSGDQVKASALQPANIREALPLIPGIVRTPEGKLQISDTPEHRNALVVNSMDVTDPATGQFGATIPIDAAAAIDVYKSPYLAEYGRFTSAVVAVETRKAADKWRWELNDPTPELRIRSAHIVGVRGFTPRIAVSGPLVANKLFLSQSTEFRLNKIPTFALQFPNNEERRQSVNTFTQLDWIPTASQFVTLTLHGVPQRVQNANPSFYNPIQTTPDSRGHEYRTALSHSLNRGQALFLTNLSAQETGAEVWPKGDRPFVMTPTGNQGDYFLEQYRRSRRYQVMETVAVTRGRHLFKAGGGVIQTVLNGRFEAQPVVVPNWVRFDFLNRGPFRLSDVEGNGFVQDSWALKPGLSLNGGVRFDYQKLSGRTRVAPRLGLAWSPAGDGNTVVRTGMGYFYDRVPLVLFGFESYPWRVVDGKVWRNETAPNGFVPQNLTWSAEVERRVGSSFRILGRYRNGVSSGLMTIRPVGETFRLEGAGRARYHQGEFVSQFSLPKRGRVVASYVRQYGVGNLNEFSGFLGDFPSPLIRQDYYMTVNGNIPHRVLVWGVLPLWGTWQVAPIVEWRSGFPWSAVDAAQQYVGTPNSYRFPRFFSLDVRVSREVKLPKGHAARVSFSMFNVTDHFNPDTVRWNVADAQFGEFLGQHRRRYRVDFDFLF